MNPANGMLVIAVAAFLSNAGLAQEQPSFIKQGQQLTREGNVEDALALYRTVLKTLPNSLEAHSAAGSALDLLGKGDEARAHFQKALDLAPEGLAKANAQRAMAMSWAFSGDCEQTVKYEQLVMQYYAAQKDFNQQGGIANEAARVCLENGDAETAYQWYLTGYQLGMKQPDITAEQSHLWAFRWEHAQARVAIRKGNRTEAEKHVAAAKAILAKDPELAKSQGAFLPYLVGYVALHAGDRAAAIEQLAKASQTDPAVQCLVGDAYEGLGQRAKAVAEYEKAAAATDRTAAAAYGRPYAMKKLAAWKKNQQ